MQETTSRSAPIVTLSIVTYNSEKWLEAFFQSLFQQNLPCDQIALCLLDNGSTDNTYAWLTKRQAELARLSERFASKQNQGLSRAAMDNDFTRYGDTSFNTRASELSQGRTQDKMYGARQNQMNYMRNLLGMPQNELSVYVEPDALQLTRPTLPDYVEDTTPNS